MPTPVWVLSVDLQTKTATFQSGMSDAAKAARGSFNDIKSGADEMGRATSGSMMEARHGVMLLGEEFGVHLPRALTSFIASIGPVGAAMEAAFPFLAIIVGATLLLEHLAKLKAEGEKLTESQTNFGTAVANVLNGLNDKLLQAGIRADELRGDHLGALNKELELIDHQSMKELVSSFDAVAKAADGTFAQLKTEFYQWGAGSAGAKNALEQFKTQYDSLLAQGKDKEANDLLAGTKASAERVLQLQKQIRDNQTVTGPSGTHQGDYNKFEQAKLALKQMGVGYDEKEIAAQEILVGALEAQVTATKTLADTKRTLDSNARQTTQNKVDSDGDKVFRQQAEAQRKADEDAEKEWEENYRRAVAAIQENERQKIEATDKGSAARLAAIDAAIKEEESKGLQETGFYRSLLQDRVSAARQMSEEQKKLEADAGKESAEHDLRMGQLRIESDRVNSQLQLTSLQSSMQARMDADIHFADEEYQIKNQAFNKDMAALNKSDKEYENKLKALQDRQKELVQEHEDQVTQIKTKAEEERNSRIVSAEQKMADEVASTTAHAIVQARNMGAMFQQLGASMVESALRNALELETAQGRQRLSDARTAASRAYEWGWEHGGPGAPVLSTALGGLAFAAAMAFEDGGIVPGVGRGDIVPAKLEPGESVLPKRMTENLTNAAKFGDGNSGDIHVHHHATYNVQAFNSDGVDQVLRQHGDKFTDHAVRTLRKMNR